jgi:hypothetical protein
VEGSEEGLGGSGEEGGGFWQLFCQLRELISREINNSEIND